MGNKKGSNSLFTDQAEFMLAGDRVLESVNSKDEELAAELIIEEYNEFSEEPWYIPAGDLGTLKECIDLIYVCCQYMNTCVGPEKAQLLWDIVHKHNMSKTHGGKLIKRADGKILKPEGFDSIGWVKEFSKVLE